MATSGTIWVEGVPRPKGSSAYMISASTGRIRHCGNEALEVWVKAIHRAADADAIEVVDGPVSLSLSFLFIRPLWNFRKRDRGQSLTNKAPAAAHHTQTPDIDKVVRAVMDALTGVVYIDDRQVIKLVASKRWSSETSGVDIVYDQERDDG